jgi:hypothetical protein
LADRQIDHGGYYYYDHGGYYYYDHGGYYYYDHGGYYYYDHGDYYTTIMEATSSATSSDSTLQIDDHGGSSNVQSGDEHSWSLSQTGAGWRRWVWRYTT